MKKLLLTFLIFSCSLIASYAQMITPQQSPHAIVSQRIGITDINIEYHRPSVKGRAIWETGIVPFNNSPRPWRAGANENTTIEFKDTLVVEGKLLPGGKYGFHIIPQTSGKWIIIFSKANTSWGSFSYNENEDALRVEVQPIENTHQEQLLYHFEELTGESATLNLDWGNKRVPIKMQVNNVHHVVLQYYADMLRGSDGFTYRGYFNYGVYCDLNNVMLDEGLIAAERALFLHAKWDTYSLKENLLRKLNRNSEADSVKAEKLEKADGPTLNRYDYQLIGEKKYDEAYKIFKKNVDNNPKNADFTDSLAEYYKIIGDKKNAIKFYKKALSLNPSPFTKANSIKMLEELGVKQK